MDYLQCCKTLIVRFACTTKETWAICLNRVTFVGLTWQTVLSEAPDSLAASDCRALRPPSSMIFCLFESTIVAIYDAFWLNNRQWLGLYLHLTDFLSFEHIDRPSHHKFGMNCLKSYGHSLKSRQQISRHQ